MLQALHWRPGEPSFGAMEASRSLLIQPTARRAVMVGSAGGRADMPRRAT